MSLIDKIVYRIRHWSNRLLTYTGRIQLIKYVSFTIVNYRMHCLPLPKHMIHKIEVMFRSFLWSGSSNVSRKSHIAWKKICNPRKCKGLNIIELGTWNNTNMLKLLWNLCRKSDSLWVRWMQRYYIKGEELVDIWDKTSHSWIVKYILKQRDSLV